jgi:histidinol dehydrogenase
VRKRGDAAVLDYTRRFDGIAAASLAELEVSPADLRAALGGLPAAQRTAIEAAAARIRAFHERQLEVAGRSWSYRDADGSLLGQKVTPLDRVGIYVPGGKAAYPSSVLMNALPAKVAGVGEIVMVAPMPGGARNPLVLAAAAVAGVDRVFAIGGAQAIGALAYGTATIPAVHKITGPGNAYGVASAKRRVFGTVGIDMTPGRARSWCWPTARRRPTGWRWTCSARPSTTSWRKASCSAPIRRISTACRKRWRGCCRPCRAAT